MEQALHFKRLGLNLHDTMVYQVAGTGAKGSNLAYWQEWEYCFVLANGKPKAVNRLTRATRVAGRRVSESAFLDRLGSRKTKGVREVGDECVRGNVWLYHAGKNTEYTFAGFDGHEAPFPLELASDHIASWSNPGDLVLDPFSGSGTTAKAAKTLGRQFIGLEVNPEYCRIAEQRIAQEVLALA
jgi:site-specific DNA-methyltransferase (adenine-specific)